MVKIRKQRKAGLSVIDFLIFGIVTLVVAGFFLFIFQKNAQAEEKNIEYLRSCNAQRGTCVAKEEDCKEGSAFKIGCTAGQEWCCISNEKKKQP